MNSNYWIAAAAFSGFLSVAAGAFGAHGLKGRLSAEMLAVFETAARYQMMHALALLGVGIIGRAEMTRWLTLASWCFLVGTILFSGSLYALALSGVKPIGAITPFGGLAFLAGWLALAVAAISAHQQ